MSRWQRHAGDRGRTERLRAGKSGAGKSRPGKLRPGKLRTGLAEGSIVYGELKAAERVSSEGSKNKHPSHAALSLRLAERGRLCFFPLDKSDGMRAGEVVRAKLLKRGRVFYAQVLESLGRFDGSDGLGGDVSFLSALSLQQLAVKTEFSPDTLSEVASLESYAYAGEREDARSLDFVTIDGAQARDFDDAVHAEEREGGGWLVRVAIADVAHYVRCGSRLDEEARARGNSRYLADRVVPMLPPRLSEHLCSLRAGEDRPCVMAEMTVDAAGALLHCRFARVAIRVSARLTYEETQKILDRRTRGEGEEAKREASEEIEEEIGEEAERAVLRLYGAWRALARARQTRGALEITRTEYVARLERDSAEKLRGTLRCVGVSALRASTAHRLIEDTMILANVAVAEHLSKAKTSFVARAHEPPSVEKWQGLEHDLATLNLSSLLGGEGGNNQAGKAENKAGGAERSGEGLRSRLRAVLAGVTEQGGRREGQDEHVSFLASEAVLRAQSQARYVLGGEQKGKGESKGENKGEEEHVALGHFALGLDCYCHFTSPIRRYADLCVHRALLELLGLGQDGSSSFPSSSLSSLSSSLCEGLVGNERSAVLLERVVFQRMVCACLGGRAGFEEEVFEGIVMKVMGFGFFVRLTHWGVEGVVMRGSFVGYRYSRAREEVEVEEARGERRGMRAGIQAGIQKGIRIAFGSRVRVRLKESDAISGRLELEFLERG